jgi:hypothetical protein
LHIIPRASGPDLKSRRKDARRIGDGRETPSRHLKTRETESKEQDGLRELFSCRGGRAARSGTQCP